MVQAVEGSATFFLFIVADALRGGTAVARARHPLRRNSRRAAHARVSRLVFALHRHHRASNSILLTFAMLVGVGMQTIAGYYHYEFLQYFKELYVVTFPQILTFAFFAVFIQTVVSNKFVGHGILIGLFVLMPILYSFGWQNTLYLVGQTPAYTYSDMNGYGHFVPAFFWSIVYWLSIAALLGVISVAFSRRGEEDSLRARIRLAMRRCSAVGPARSAFRRPCLSVPAAGTSTTLTSSMNISTDNARRDIQADYERKFKQYENLLQPKVTAVEAPSTFIPSDGPSTEPFA